MNHFMVRSIDVNQTIFLFLYTFYSVCSSQINASFMLAYLVFFRFIQYKPTSLERSYKYDLLTEPDLGVTIDLINPDTYKIDPNGNWFIVVCRVDHFTLLYFALCFCISKSLYNKNTYQ